MGTQDLTIENIEANRASLLEKAEARLRIVRDLVRGVGRCYSTGVYLYGPGGTGKTRAVRQVLEEDVKVSYVYRRGHLTALGLFELLAENKDEVIVLDDVAALFAQPIAVQVLLAALEQPKKGRERRITYKRKGGEDSFAFRGGVIAISNLALHNDAGLLQALKSRVNTVKYDPPADQLAAQMLDIASRGWPPGGGSVPPEEATAVARHVVAETLRVGGRLDLRTFVDKALPMFMQCRDDEAESHWEDLVTACVEEGLSEPKHEAESPAGRAARMEAEARIALEIYSSIPDRESRNAAWEKATGKSSRAFYRRLEDARG